MNALPALFRREVLRLLRQPARIVGAIITPALLLVVLASALSGALPGIEAGGGGFAAYLAPGSIALVALFAGIFNAIALIEDRREGLMRSLLAGPTPGRVAVLARLSAGSLISLAQASVFLVALPVLGVEGLGERVLPALGAAALCCVTLQAACLIGGWVCGSTASFHTVMNTALMPAWLLSGSFFPIESASGWIRALAWVNPVAWLVDLQRAAVLGIEPAMGSQGAVWGVSVGWALVFVAAALVVARRNRG